MYRSDSYDEKLSQKLKDPEFGQEYLLELVENEDEPMDIESALRFMIGRMGTSDFAGLVRENKANEDKFLKERRRLKEETLNRYLKPFHLKVKKSLERVA